MKHINKKIPRKKDHIMGFLITTCSTILRPFKNGKLMLLSVFLALFLISLLFGAFYYYYGVLTNQNSFRIQARNLIEYKVEFLLHLFEKHSNIYCMRNDYLSRIYHSKPYTHWQGCRKRTMTIQQKDVLRDILFEIVQATKPAEMNVYELGFTRDGNEYPFSFVEFNNKSLKYYWMQYYFYLYSNIEKYKSFTIEHFTINGPYSKIPRGEQFFLTDYMIYDSYKIHSSNFVTITFHHYGIKDSIITDNDSENEDKFYMADLADTSSLFLSLMANKQYDINFFRSILLLGRAYHDLSIEPHAMELIADDRVGINRFSNCWFYSLLILGSFGNSDIEPENDLIRVIMLIEVYIGLILVGTLIAFAIRSLSSVLLEMKQDKEVLKQ